MSPQGSSECVVLNCIDSTGENARPSSPSKQQKSRWVQFGIPTLLFTWLTVVCFVVVLVSSAYGGTHGACKPDGSFSPYVDDYSLWSGAGFFSIEICMGKLSFSQAKVIDIFWDMVVGRGGQAVLAYISWRVFADFMAASIERTPVTYRTFWRVYLEQESSLWAIGTLLVDRTFYRALRHKIVVAFTVFSLILILVFPTAASAMTGYVTHTKPFIRD
ncbi:hypothetical protein QBC44DRAFT_251050, partial [Cladorrhinum sp. PSN332]